MVSWQADIFSPINQSCINGYEWSINGELQGEVTRVILGNTVLQNVILNGTTCDRGEVHFWNFTS